MVYLCSIKNAYKGETKGAIVKRNSFKETKEMGWHTIQLYDCDVTLSPLSWLFLFFKVIVFLKFFQLHDSLVRKQIFLIRDIRLLWGSGIIIPARAAYLTSLEKQIIMHPSTV